MKEIYMNCPFTKEDSEILEQYDKKSHPYITLKGEDIYSPCYCVVIQVCKYDSDNLYSVVLQYNEFISIRINKLTNIYIKNGMKLKEGMPVGDCNKLFEVELLESDVPKNIPIFRVMIAEDYSLYKYDPNLIIDGTIRFKEPSMPDGEIIIKETEEELSDGRG